MEGGGREKKKEEEEEEKGNIHALFIPSASVPPFYFAVAAWKSKVRTRMSKEKELERGEVTMRI